MKSNLGEYLYDLRKKSGKTIKVLKEELKISPQYLNDIKNNKTITLKLTLIWENNEEFNESDTKLGTIEANKLKIPITITLNQYQG